MEVVDAQSSPVGDTTNRILSPFSYVLILLGVCAHLVGFLVFRVVSYPLPTRDASPPFVQFPSFPTPLFGAVLDKLVANSHSPLLFVPGIWNSSHNLPSLTRVRTSLSYSSYADFYLTLSTVSTSE